MCFKVGDKVRIKQDDPSWLSDISSDLDLMWNDHEFDSEDEFVAVGTAIEEGKVCKITSEDSDGFYLEYKGYDLHFAFEAERLEKVK